MADVGFVNSGYAVANTLQDILARKEKARHDDLLEQIAKQNSDTQRITALGQEDERHAIAKYREAQADNYRRDDMVRGQKLSPEDRNWLNSTGFGGRVETAPQYELPEGAQGPVPQDETYAGSPKEQLEAKQQAKQDALLRDPEFWKKDRLEQFMLARQAGLPNFNPEQFRKADAQHHLYVLDEATGQTRIADPIGLDGKPVYPETDIHMTRSRAPIGPAKEPKYTWTFSNDGTSMMRMPNSGTELPKVFSVADIMSGKVPQSALEDAPAAQPQKVPTFGGRPDSSTKVQPIVPSNLIGPLAKATDSRAKATLMSGILANSGASDVAKDSMQRYMNKAITNEKLNQLPIEQIAAGVPGSDADKRQFAMLLQVYRSGGQ